MAKKKEDSAQSTHSRTGAGAKGDGGLDIRVDSHNYRLHPDKNKDLIRRSLQENGAGRSIVVDNTGEAIGGSGVLEQAEKLGIKKKLVETNGDELVVVVRKDISPDDPRRKRLAVADNAATDLSEWDEELLKTDFKIDELAGFGIKLPKEMEKIDEKPEVEFTEELLEEHNYIVLFFDNSIDWLQAQSLFDLKTVKALDSKTGFEKQGVGRVLKGSEALDKLIGKEWRGEGA